MWSGRLAVLACAALGLASSAAAQSAPNSRQAIYDAAQAAFDRGDWPAAISGFEQVAAPVGVAAPSHSQALMRSRLAEAYLKTGRYEDARVSASFAIKGLNQGDRDDLVGAAMVLGDANRFELDMPDAIVAYRRAIDAAPGDQGADARRTALIHIALAATVTDPAAAAESLDAVLADKAFVSTLSKKTLSEIEDLRGRAEINRGDPKAAAPILRQAVADSGGLSTSRVDIVQAEIRGDAAIAAELVHDDDRAHEYLAGTGSGFNDSELWIQSADMQPPVCDPSRDLLATDTAVVQFAIDAQGTVIGAAPVYASRPGRMGVEFAKAVRLWRWSPDSVAKLNRFWRDMIRIQLRCVEQPQPIELSDIFFDATALWLASQGAGPDDIALFESRAVASSDPRLLREDASGVAALLARTKTPGAGRIDPLLLARLNQAVNSLQAPADVRAFVLVQGVEATMDGHNYSYRALAAKLGAARPAFEATWPNSRAAAWLAVEQAIALENGRRMPDAAPLLKTVLAYPDTVLPKDDPIRVLAVLHLTMIERKGVDTTLAVAEAGLKPGQCSLLDVRPVATDIAIGSDDFPAAAQRWGFEGYVRVAFDIDGLGHPQDVRTVVAYPPFIFNKTTEAAFTRSRYLTQAIDGVAVGCAGHTQSVRFKQVGSPP